MKYYKCGHIMTTHGLKGALKIKDLSDFDRFYKNSTLYILYKNEYIKVKVFNKTNFDNYYLVTFYDLLDINLVEKYKNCDIYVSELDRNDDLDEDEYYNSDLLGKEIMNQNNEIKGKVIEIREYPACNYLVVNYNDKNTLIPFNKQFIKEVNDKYIVIDEIEGLY